MHKLAARFPVPIVLAGLVLVAALVTCTFEEEETTETQVSAASVAPEGKDGEPDPLSAPPASESELLLPPDPASRQPVGPDWPRGEVFVPTDLFQSSALGRAVLKSNPRLYLYPDFDPAADPIMVIGMPGWGGRSENFIWVLINGLKREGLTRRLVVATIQDTDSGGPGYQGQGDRAHANVWPVTRQAVDVMGHFVASVADKVGHLRVYLLGYSTGGVSAPLLAARVAQLEKPQVAVEGAVSLGTAGRIPAATLNSLNQRVLFVVVPPRRSQDPKPMRDDQWNRIRAERELERLVQDGGTAYLRHIESARRHVDWHWGLISQCRYFRTSRLDDGRGYWPNYWMPNPETAEAVASFIQGQAPPVRSDFPPTPCPY
jgi:pimeloyl-ACP methyl ester carboxylesterase